eukprot:1145380-Pelagomonas_calceolata.AAC.7
MAFTSSFSRNKLGSCISRMLSRVFIEGIFGDAPFMGRQPLGLPVFRPLTSSPRNSSSQHRLLHHTFVDALAGTGAGGWPGPRFLQSTCGLFKLAAAEPTGLYDSNCNKIFNSCFKEGVSCYVDGGKGMEVCRWGVKRDLHLPWCVDEGASGEQLAWCALSYACMHACVNKAWSAAGRTDCCPRHYMSSATSGPGRTGVTNFQASLATLPLLVLEAVSATHKF